MPPKPKSLPNFPCPHEELITRMGQQVTEIHETLLGKPPEHVGVLMRVDRLERQKWQIRAMWAALAASMGAWFK